jgi:hypothetical protein
MIRILVQLKDGIFSRLHGGSQLTPHRSATVWNSFPTPSTSSSFRLRVLLEFNNCSKFFF